MKDHGMTIRLEPELRARFVAAAKSQRRPAAQVLRELMRDYVDRSQVEKISADERHRREEALKFAIANVGLEGFEVSQGYREQAERYVNGEIEFAELTEFVKAESR